MTADYLTWLIPLAIGVLFGWAWGYSAGQRAGATVLVTLPDTPKPEASDHPTA